MLRELLPELDDAPPGAVARRPRPDPAHRDPDRRRQPRAPSASTRSPRGGPAERAAWRRSGRRAAVRRPDQHPVHLRHHRQPEGRHAHPPQRAEQRLLHRRGHAARPRGPAVHPRAAVSLLRHGPGQPGRPHPRRLHGLPRRGLRPAGGAGDRGGGALHRAARRAHHVHRRDGAPALRRVRPVQPAHRHHGRVPLPDRGHAPRGGPHAPARDHHRLRHDRDEPGQLPDRRRRPAGAPRVDGRPGPSASGGQGHRRRGPHRPARGDRGAVHPRLQRDAGLLGRRPSAPRR